LISVLRAAGFTAAAFVAALFPAFADPSQAVLLQQAQLGGGVAEHEAALVNIPAETAPAPELVQGLATQDTPPTIPTGHEAAFVPAERIELSEIEEEEPAKRSLLALVDEHASEQPADAELECLAGAIYFESKGEPLAGQLAVAEVVINRSKSGRYPATLCGVVKQRGQFSFVRGGRLPTIPKASPHWRKAVGVAQVAISDLADSPAENALAFHATYVSPGWRMKRVARVGNHIFYR
jgi:spore germination cell wall hydrolase CwlJ-like protein